jgi:hypothetical protein
MPGSQGDDDESMGSPPESSSLSSSYGSPGSDLAELRHLKSQFGQQEQLLGQLRTALQGNSDRLASKEQEVQVYPSTCRNPHLQIFPGLCIEVG